MLVPVNPLPEVVVLLANRPRMIPFPLLTQIVRDKLPNAPPRQEGADPVARALGEALLRCYQSHLVELRMCAPPDVLDLSERPRASPLARWQAQRDWTHVTNLRSQVAFALDEPRRLLESVNSLFCENSPESAFASLFFAEYHDPTGGIRYVNCGHLCALLLRRDGTLERLAATSTVLGLFREWECAVGECRLESGIR